MNRGGQSCEDAVDERGGQMAGLRYMLQEYALAASEKLRVEVEKKLVEAEAIEAKNSAFPRG